MAFITKHYVSTSLNGSDMKFHNHLQGCLKFYVPLGRHVVYFQFYFLSILSICSSDYCCSMWWHTSVSRKWWTCCLYISWFFISHETATEKKCVCTFEAFMNSLQVRSIYTYRKAAFASPFSQPPVLVLGRHQSRGQFPTAMLISVPLLKFYNNLRYSFIAFSCNIWVRKKNTQDFDNIFFGKNKQKTIIFAIQFSLVFRLFGTAFNS